MPPTKYHRVGERPPPRGPVTDRLWQPPPRSAPDDADAPPEPPQPERRRRLARHSPRRPDTPRRRPLRPAAPTPA